MRRTIYIVGILKENLRVKSLGTATPVIMEAPCSWAQGMCGAFPAFWQRSDAEAYRLSVGADYTIEEFEVDGPTVH